MKSEVKPLNPLIYRTAAQFAAEWYEIGRSQGLTSIHKNAKRYAAANFEKFVPKVIETFLHMLKPTSGISEHMKQEIYSALIDPVNDPNLVPVGVKSKPLPDIDIEKIIRTYDKNQMKFNDLSSKPSPN